MRAAIIIPARLESSRLHQKMLQTIGGIPVIAHTAAKCLESNAERVFVATDSQLIVDAVSHLNVTPVLTPPNLATGSDRVAYVANTLAAEFDVVVNVQGDEPFLNPKIIDMLLADFQQQYTSKLFTHQVNTACVPIVIDNNTDNNPSEVKVVVDANGFALYFSRYPIPFVRNTETSTATHLQHLGIYGFQRSFLLEFTQMERTPLEVAESLEQLRLLEHGHKIRVLKTATNPSGGSDTASASVSVSIDTAEDLAKAEAIYKNLNN